MIKKLEILLNALNKLDKDRICLVKYEYTTMELVICQLGGNVVRLNHLVGYLTPVEHTCIWFPEDIQSVKNFIRYMIDSKNTFMIYPIKGGYKIYGMGDIAYTSKPDRKSVV